MGDVDDEKAGPQIEPDTPDQDADERDDRDAGDDQETSADDGHDDSSAQ